MRRRRQAGRHDPQKHFKQRKDNQMEWNDCCLLGPGIHYQGPYFSNSIHVLS
jgi:hypothetical protein